MNTENVDGWVTNVWNMFVTLFIMSSSILLLVMVCFCVFAPGSVDFCYLSPSLGEGGKVGVYGHVPWGHDKLLAYGTDAFQAVELAEALECPLLSAEGK